VFYKTLPAMSVIAQLRIPASSFELGRILEMGGATSIELENLVPLGEKAVPFFTVHEASRDAFEENVRDHPSVDSIRVMSQHDSRTLYALDWAVSRDLFFQGLQEGNAHLLSATGTSETWAFEIRFPNHEALSGFKDHCANAHISLDVRAIYNPTKPDAGPWYGLTDPQRETLIRAVEGGYYSIPRRMSTQDLADRLGVSDQAVTERLRRAIVTLVESTLTATQKAEEAEPAE
jgi:predicted DNA binding protein